jgi:hypothetical protein
MTLRENVPLLAFALVLAGCSGGAQGPPDAPVLSPDAPARLPDAPALLPDAPVVLPDAPGTPDAATLPDAVPLPTNRPIGVNLPFLYWELSGFAGNDKGRDRARASLHAARTAGFTYARFIPSAYWPQHTMFGWLGNPDAYWAQMDAIFDDARAEGMRLVPTLIWNYHLFPDLAGEPVSMLFTPGSATRKLAERFITEFVTRYRGRDNVLFWEIANEMNLWADQDPSRCDVCSGGANDCGNLADLAPSLGTPCKRTRADEFYSCNSCRQVSSQVQDLGELHGSLAALVHSLDPGRKVSSGDAAPLPFAHHVAVHPDPGRDDGTWDSPTELAAILAQLHPDGVDILSIHFGPDVWDARFGNSDRLGLPVFDVIASTAASLKKELYVGEFYLVSRPGDYTCAAGTFSCADTSYGTDTRHLLDEIVRADAAYASVWDFQTFNGSCPEIPDCLAVLEGEPMALAMAAANGAYGTCAAVKDGTACPLGACAQGTCRRTPALALPIDSAADLASWVAWTSCSGCTQGALTFETSNGGGFARVTAHDLPCTGDCAYPGSYAASAPVASKPGELFLHFSARASVAGADLGVIALDGAGKQIGETHVPIVASATFIESALGATLPAGTASWQLRLSELTPDATADLDSVTVEYAP